MRAPTDPAGFGWTCARTSSSRDDEFTAIALAPGYGAGWAGIDPDADQPVADISLQPEQIIQGRLFDLQGRPAQGVVVSVSAIRRVVVPDSPGRGQVRSRLCLATRVPLTGGLASTIFQRGPSPRPPTPTDGFEVRGVGRRLRTQVNIIDPRFALQTIDVETERRAGAKSVTDGSATGQGFHRSRDIRRHRQARSGCQGRDRRHQSERGPGPNFLTDADGRFRANASAGDSLSPLAAPPAGQLYLSESKRVEWPKGAVEQSVDLTLPRGVVIRGRVIEEGSDQPIAGASVVFQSHSRPGADVKP